VRAPNRARHRVAAAGLAVVLAYLGLAALSGHLSPLARRPLLDGYGPPVQYNWVSPPPELAATNSQPPSGDFTLPLTDRGNRPDVLTTDDAQFTIILVAGTIPPAAGQDEVRIVADPIDPSTLDPPDPPLDFVGNAYRVRATYEPGGREIRSVMKPIETILVYPLPPNVHATTHSVISSPDGSQWEVAQGTDSSGNQQVEGPVPTFGYVSVGGDLQAGAASPSVSVTTDGGRSTLGIALIVGAVCAALVGIGLLLRGR
jgi:hypothetical protein